MYKIIGERLTGKEINKKYDNVNIAKFEYECFTTIAKWVGLYRIDGDNEIEQKLYIK